MITPLTDHGTLDVEGLERLIERIARPKAFSYGGFIAGDGLYGRLTNHYSNADFKE